MDIYVKVRVSGRPTEMDDVGCQGLFIESTEIVRPTPQTLQTRISTWATKTFSEGHGQRTEGVYAHLKREIDELGLGIALAHSPEAIGEECADCAMLLFELADFARSDLLDEVEKKLAINRERKWGPIQEDGSILHIKEEDDDSN
jgi:hypothetical protein